MHKIIKEKGSPKGMPNYKIIVSDQLLQQPDYVLTHIRYSWGGAAKFANEAKRLDKIVIDL